MQQHKAEVPKQVFFSKFDKDVPTETLQRFLAEHIRNARATTSPDFVKYYLAAATRYEIELIRRGVIPSPPPLPEAPEVHPDTGMTQEQENDLLALYYAQGGEGGFGTAKTDVIDPSDPLFV